MIKKTLYFGNACRLRLKNRQLTVDFPTDDNKESAQIAVEDIGLILLDHPRITLSQQLITALMGNNACVIGCDAQHLPFAIMTPLYSHTEFSERLRYQMEASLPLKKNLWMQCVQQKIRNQAAMLAQIGLEYENLLHWATHVKSGDPGNLESRAAAYYWKVIFTEEESFSGRHREGAPPNNLLNYCYAIIRSMVARALVSSGLLPVLGIHHRNKYNPYCLADDIMEAFRPYGDRLVFNVIREFDEYEELSPQLKRALLGVAQMDVEIDGQKSPMMVGISRTTASLMRCYEGVERKLSLPEMPFHA